MSSVKKDEKNLNVLTTKEKEELQKLSSYISSIIPNIRGENGMTNSWRGKEGMCEWCGLRPATINLDLKAGTHRECQICWDD